jgi:CheY-like chemotaxis protein
MESFLKIVEAITPLTQSLIWPALLLFLLFRFSESIRTFIENLSVLKLKAADVEVSATREQIKAAALVGAASQRKPGDADGNVDAAEIADAVYRFSKHQTKNTGPVRILWVDDHPSNNYYEREALEKMGIEFGIARSTDEALGKLAVSRFDMIISDMGRPPDSRAGYTLLDKLRGAGNNIPFVIYAGSRTPEHQRESLEHGAVGCTNRADELFILVSKGLVASKA